MELEGKDAGDKNKWYQVVGKAKYKPWVVMYIAVT